MSNNFLSRATRIGKSILQLQRQGRDGTLADIASEYGISISTVNRYAKALREAGFIFEPRRGKRRPNPQEHLCVRENQGRRLSNKALERIAYIKQWNGIISNYRIAKNLRVAVSYVYRLMKIIESTDGVSLFRGPVPVNIQTADDDTFNLDILRAHNGSRGVAIDFDHLRSEFPDLYGKNFNNQCILGIDVEMLKKKFPDLHKDNK